jgi:hypothetical protein
VKEGAPVSFRRKRDEWDEFLKRHGPALRDCGLPDYLIAKKLRFLVFLDHGYDDCGRVEGTGTFFHSDWLTGEQISRLADIVEESIDSRYGHVIRSRWMQTYHGPSDQDKGKRDGR